MKHRLINVTILLFILFCLSACSSSEGTPSGVFGQTAETTLAATETTVPPEPKQEYEEGSYTLFIYMCGSSLETKNGSATKNISEMLSVPLPEKTRLVIETGGTKKWRKYDIPSESCRYEIENGELKQLENRGAKNMGDAETLSSFLSWGIDAYPAEKYSLILWDHGGGSVKGVCYDELFAGDALTLSELGEALSNGLRKYKTKLDFIGFDACLMATVENAMTVSDYAENMLASQELEPAGGWDYTALLPEIGTAEFYQTVLDSYSKKSEKGSDYYTLSHIDFSEFSAVTDRFGALVEKLKKEPLQVTVVNALSDAATFGVSGGGKTDLYDLGNLLECFELGGELSPCVEKIGSATRSTATGLSVFFPLNDPSYAEEYRKINPFDFYSEYLDLFFSYREKETISFLSYDTGAIENNRFSFVLTPESMDYFWKAEYYLYATDKDDISVFYSLGWDNDVLVEGNTITVLFEGNWVEFGGQRLLCEPKETNGTVTVFRSSIFVNDEEALLLFSFDSATSETRIIGITYAADNFSRIYDIPENAQIDVVMEVASLEPDGSQKNDSTYGIDTDNRFQYSADTPVKVARLPDGVYQYTAVVTDIYGKPFVAGTVNLWITDGETSIFEANTSLVGSELVD